MHYFQCCMYFSYYQTILVCSQQSAEDDTGDDTCGSKLPKELTDHHAIAEHVNKDFTADER